MTAASRSTNPPSKGQSLRHLLPAGIREIHGVVRGVTPTHAHLRSRILFLVVMTVILDVVASGFVYLFERHAAGTEITTVGDSLFWTSTQLLTVSSQLRNPISTPARILDILLQAYAISVVAVLAGSFGAFMHRRGIERDPLDAAGRMEPPLIPLLAYSEDPPPGRRQARPAARASNHAKNL